MDQHNGSDGLMMKIATLIVDKRNLFMLLSGIALVFSMFSSNWVIVENELSEYLPEDSEARQGLDIMEEEFVTYGTARIMVQNISVETADRLSSSISDMDGVMAVSYDETDDYKDSSALYSVTFDYSETDDRCLDVLADIEESLEIYDVYVSTELGDQQAEILDQEVRFIMVWVALIVVSVLCLTSQTWGEVPVLILTFLAAMILNSGSNFLLGKISFVSNSVTSILQLALSLDYAVILCNRFKEEHETLPLREAVIVALSKGIPEIGASSLTTIGGLVAMMFMQFQIGPDMAICLIKAILYSLFSVFVIMPALLMVFGPLMEKTKHRNYVPKIPFVGKMAYKTRHVVPPVFLVALVLAFFLSKNCPYAYGYSILTTPKLNETQIAEDTIDDLFGSNNTVAIIIPSGDYDTERKLLDRMEQLEEVDSAQGLSNTEAMGGYMLTDRLTPRQFSELMDMDYEVAVMAYTAYAASNEEYKRFIGSTAGYSVPLIDMMLFACDQVDQGLISLDNDQLDTLHLAQTMMESGKKQLQGQEHNRVVISLHLPVSGDETYAFLDTLRDTAEEYYPDSDIYVVGESTTEYDFKKSFATDNLVVTIVSILIVLVVLLFTFRSVGMPLLLILVIQGSIWLNFSIPTIRNRPLFFMSYLVVSSIQMGANIDYAIVIASRFSELKKEMSQEEAMIETMNFAFPTILTSGTVLSTAGILVGQLTSDAAIVGIGSIGRGTIISMILVMFVLPQIILLGNGFVERTSFAKKQKDNSFRAGNQRVRIDGVVSGEIHGTVRGTFHGVIDGDVNVNVVNGTAGKEAEHEEKTA